MTKRCLVLMTLALTGGGCASTSAAEVQRPSAETVWADTGTGEGQPDQPRVVIEAASPDDVQFRTDPNGTVVPLQPLLPPIRKSVKPRVGTGMLIGAGVGVVLGAMSGSERDAYARAHPDANCDPFSCGGNGLLSAAGGGAIGLGLGAAAGAIFGLLENAFGW